MFLNKVLMKNNYYIKHVKSRAMRNVLLHSNVIEIIIFFVLLCLSLFIGKCFVIVCITLI